MTKKDKENCIKVLKAIASQLDIRDDQYRPVTFDDIWNAITEISSEPEENEEEPKPPMKGGLNDSI